MTRPTLNPPRLSIENKARGIMTGFLRAISLGDGTVGFLLYGPLEGTGDRFSWSSVCHRLQLVPLLHAIQLGVVFPSAVSALRMLRRFCRRGRKGRIRRRRKRR
ncbi:hypothetical protein B0H10DRAFT_1384318 [Mycena sp. CBHHK59/15]|nr:hypothetical protein B0H10DRAFT_1384318 [Mycena sp. CBHHK59/15]